MTQEGPLAWFNAGFSIIPIRADGSKRPLVEWQQYQHRLPTREEVDRWFADDKKVGVAVICGAVSGNVEMTEIEALAADRNTMESIELACESHGVLDVWRLLLYGGYSERSPSGGVHLIYRLADNLVPGNTKIARTAELVVLAETRGEGGYTIVAPSGPEVHRDSKPWVELFSSVIGEVPTITWEQRKRLHEAIRWRLDKSPEMPEFTTLPPRPITIYDPDRLTPGDDFAQQTDWSDILAPHGWTLVSQRGQERFWARPGKDPKERAWSASTGYNGEADRLYVWSTSTPFPIETPLNKFHVYTYYNHGGDYSAASRELRNLGFGGLREDRTYRVDDLVGDDDRQVAVGQSPIRLHPMSDLGNGHRINDRLEGQVRWLADREAWCAWNGQMWDCSKVARQHVTSWTAEILEKLYEQEGLLWPDEPSEGSKLTQRGAFKAWCTRQQSTARLKAAVEAAQTDKRIWISSIDLDPDQYLLNTPNGVVDLRTGELHVHDPHMLMSMITGASYDPDQSAARWATFLERVMPDPQEREYLQRIAGYSLTGSMAEQALFLHYGRGANGKSVFMEVLLQVMGGYGQATPRSALLARQNEGASTDIARMQGKRFLATSETGANKRMDEELVKGLTSGDKQTARFLYENSFEFRPTGKIHIATNHLPKMSDADSMWRRVHLIDWAVTVPYEEQDPTLVERLVRTEAGAILAWMVRGAVAWWQTGLAPTKAAYDRTRQYRRDEDVLADFIEDQLEEVDDADAAYSTLFRAYQAWALNTGTVYRLTQRQLIKQLVDRGYRRSDRRINHERSLAGLRVRFRGAEPLDPWKA